MEIYGIIYIMDYIIIRSTTMDIGISARMVHYIHGSGTITIIVTSHQTIMIIDLGLIIKIGTDLIMMEEDPKVMAKYITIVRKVINQMLGTVVTNQTMTEVWDLMVIIIVTIKMVGLEWITEDQVQDLTTVVEVRQ